MEKEDKPIIAHVGIGKMPTVEEIQQDRIDTLKDRIAAKDKRIEELEKELADIKAIIRLHHLDVMFSVRGINVDEPTKLTNK